MAPLGDCQAISMGRFIDTLLSTSINSMCASSNDARMVSPVEQYVDQSPPRSRSDKGILDISGYEVTPTTANNRSYRHSQSLPANLNSSFRNRKPSGLSISAHDLTSTDLTKSPPAPIYCARNVEMRRKSLAEKTFFRPVSEDDESEFTVGQWDSSRVNDAISRLYQDDWLVWHHNWSGVAELYIVPVSLLIWFLYKRVGYGAAFI